MNRISYPEALSRLKTILSQEGIRAAVIFLNKLTKHRFTSLYRFDGAILHNLYFYDSEHPDEHSSPAIPVMASYCVFVRDSGARFETQDSLHDDRLSNHPKREILQSYCGVPLLDSDGRMFGTICHYDFKQVGIADDNVELLEDMARLLKQREQPL